MVLLRLLPLLLAALRPVGAVSMEAVEVFSGSNCIGTPDALAIYNTTANCAEDSCSDIDFGNKTYRMTRTCNVSDRFTHVKQVFGEFTYVIMETYDNKSCANFGEADTFLASGSCEISSGFGDQSAITSLFANGSAVVTLYPNDGCGGEPSLYFELDRTALSTSSCQQDLYRFYSSESSSDVGSSPADTNTTEGLSESGSGSVSPVDARASSLSGSTGTSDSGSHGSDFGTGAIVGIIAAAVVVVLVIALIVGYRLRKKRDDEFDEENDGFNNLRSPSGGRKKNSSSTAPGTLDSRSEGGNSGSSKPLSLVGLWDDEVIATARIPREKVVIERSISRGGGGEVYVGLYNQQQVAIKMLLPETRKSVKHVNAFLAEVKLMATLEHARIVLFIGVAWDSLTDLCVVSEFMEGGDLRALLTSYEKERHPRGFDRTKVTIALHVAHALTYLHSLETPVLHRDLKSKNVLLTAELEAKLTDFGISRERADDMTAGVGTSLWMAPEVMLGQRYDDKADMFSFGIVLSELDRQALPYADAKDKYGSDTAILQLVAQGKIHVEFSSGVLESMVSLGHSCVALDAKDRPTAAQALYRLQTILSKEM